jgi:L-fuconolactonase
MIKIDTHQHYWRFQPQEYAWISPSMPQLQRDCLPQDCAAARQAAGVNAVVAVQARTLPQETDFLLQLADQHPEIVGVVGWADLQAHDLQAQLDVWCQHPAFTGLRHVLQDEPDVAAWVNTPAVNQNLRLMQQHRLVYDVLVFEHQMPSVINFCAQHDQHWLVLDHVGKPALRDWSPSREQLRPWAKHLRQLAALPHVLCKLSGLVTETQWQHGQGLSLADAQAVWACFDQALEAFGPERLMYGSDWPVCQLSSDYQALHELAQTWAQTALSAPEQSAFWGANAQRCYGLTVPAPQC